MSRFTLPRMRSALVAVAVAAAATAFGAPSATAQAEPETRATATQIDDLRSECAQRAEAQQERGWLKSRFESCHHKRHDIVLVKTGTGERLGTLAFDEWVLGFAYDGSRRVDYVASIEDIVVSTVPGQDARTWSIRMDFLSSQTGAGDIVRPASQTRDELLGGWDTTPHWTLTYTSPTDTATDPWGIVRMNVIVALSVHAPTAIGWQDTVTRYSNVRFDSAGPVAGKHHGTVFSQARVVVPFNTGPDSGFPQSARHYNDALNNPVLTFPSIIGKNVPGIDAPLHRTLDTSRQAANTAQAVRTCNDVWGPYDGTLLNCDEYPFASTREGAANAEGNYSARLIDAADNQAAGRWLNSYYTANRILDGDPFYVAITS